MFSILPKFRPGDSNEFLLYELIQKPQAKKTISSESTEVNEAKHVIAIMKTWKRGPLNFPKEHTMACNIIQVIFALNWDKIE